MSATRAFVFLHLLTKQHIINVAFLVPLLVAAALDDDW